eukprot:snap_masked-scaffold_46-processed-gene-1.0-mRNA-1 protein AED:1.00 eAED:1.00 QI:0/-1/0/0/-1/1/1/0/99
MTDTEKLGNAVYANDQGTKLESYLSSQKLSMISHQLPLTHYSKDKIVDRFRAFLHYYKGPSVQKFETDFVKYHKILFDDIVALFKKQVEDGSIFLTTDG